MGSSVLQVSLLILGLFLCSEVDLCCGLNAEGRALLKVKEQVVLDPYRALDGWVGGDHCSWFGVWCSDEGRVEALNLKDLRLEGTLAPELGKLTYLKSMVLCNNSFSGNIPREIGDLQKLERLDLEHNNLSGPLPSSLAKILSPGNLILTSNRFIGRRSAENHDLSLLSEHRTGKDHVTSHTRSVQRSVGIVISRRLLQLGNNGVSGGIKKNQTNSRASPAPRKAPSPSQFTLKRQLSPSPSPYLSPLHSPRNSPSPSIATPSPSPAPSPSPVTEAPSPVRHSNSNFQATPPSTSLPSAPVSENPWTTAVTSFAGHHRKHHWKIYASVLPGVSFLLIVAGIYLVCCQAKVVTVRPWATGLSGQLQKAFVTGVPVLKRAEIEVACEDFSNIIGTLPDCILYKGTLSSGVEIVVMSSLITSAKDWPKQSETLFRKKISMLSKVNHKNFINLLGYCEEVEPFTRMMVFEYAPNGTIYEHLHIKEAEPLNWAARLRVAMGIAYCLEHMHHLNPPVILRNLDSSSIYLTDDYAAKISDLGFWNIEKEAQPGSGNSVLLDTPKPDSKSIVHKFGIVLLELLSGRVPFSAEEGLLEQWALCYLTGKQPLEDMVDPTLKSLRDEEINALCEVIKSCIDPDPKERPTMAQIARQLRDITAMAPESATPKLSPLWWAELEIISSEAN